MPYVPPPSGGSGIPASTVTTKGDLIVATASATVARQGVGADGTVLVANSGQATGVNWRALTAADIGPGTFQSGAYNFPQNPTLTRSTTPALNFNDGTRNSQIGLASATSDILVGSAPGDVVITNTSGRTFLASLATSGNANIGGTLSENGNRVYSAGNAPPYPVTSVATRTGAVTLTAADIAPGTFAASSQYIFPNGTWVAIQGTALDLSAANGTTSALGTGVGDKIALYGNSFGFGVQANRLVAYLPTAASFAVRAASGTGNASSGADVFLVSGAGAVTASGLVTANAGISVPAGQALTTGTRSVFTGARTVTTNASDTVDLGTFSTTGGAMELRLHAHLVGGTSVVTKIYELAMQASMGAVSTWYLCLPADASQNAAATADFALEVQRTAANTFQFRFRQKTIQAAGLITWTVEALGDTAVTFTPSTTVTAAPAAVTTPHPSNAFVAAAGQVGINTEAPGALLDVNGTARATDLQVGTTSVGRGVVCHSEATASTTLSTSTSTETTVAPTSSFTPVSGRRYRVSISARFNAGTAGALNILRLKSSSGPTTVLEAPIYQAVTSGGGQMQATAVMNVVGGTTPGFAAGSPVTFTLVGITTVNATTASSVAFTNPSSVANFIIEDIGT